MVSSSSKLLLARVSPWILIAVCVGILALQLFIPPFIGLADNGDFPKVTGRFSLGPEGGHGDKFQYFKSDYVYAPEHAWRSGLPSSELVLTKVALRMAKLARMGERFDIRFLGFVHASLFVAAFAILLRSVPWPAAAFALFVFTDVAYVAYFNSFYSDTPAFLGLMLTVAFAVRILRSGSNLPSLIGYTLSAVLMITGKSQHVPVGLLTLALPAWIAMRSLRIPALVSSVCIAASAVFMLVSTPKMYPVPAVFNIIFLQIAGQSNTPQADLRELGLDESYGRYIGMHAFMPESPASSDQWLADFAGRTGYRQIGTFYARHPDRALAILRRVLWDEAPVIRPTNFANFRRVDGKPPGTLTDRFDTWSNFRIRLFELWRPYVVVWYVVVLAACVILLRRPLAVMCALIALAGVFEFVLAGLADAAETGRHLFFFHACTDLTICFAVIWAINGAREGLRPSLASRRS